MLSTTTLFFNLCAFISIIFRQSKPRFLRAKTPCNRFEYYGWYSLTSGQQTALKRLWERLLLPADGLFQTHISTHSYILPVRPRHVSWLRLNNNWWWRCLLKKNMCAAPIVPSSSVQLLWSKVVSWKRIAVAVEALTAVRINLTGPSRFVTPPE